MNTEEATSQDWPRSGDFRAVHALVRRRVLQRTFWARIQRETMVPVLEGAVPFHELMERLPRFAELMNRLDEISDSTLRISDVGAAQARKLGRPFDEDVENVVRTAVADFRRARKVQGTLEDSSQMDTVLTHPLWFQHITATMAASWGLNVLSAWVMDADFREGYEREMPFVLDMVRHGAADGFVLLRAVQKDLNPDAE